MTRSRLTPSYFRGLCLGVSLCSLSAGAHGQTANPTSLDFPSVPLGATSAVKTTTISAAAASYTLKIDGPNKDQFTVTTPTCADAQLKNSSCNISNAGGAAPTPVVLTVAFTTPTTAQGMAWVYAVDTAGVSTRLLTLTGTGF
jgi:hypothetical protein